MSILLILILIIIIGSALVFALRKKQNASYVVVAISLALLLQYGPYPFLDEQGKGELIMWQMISLPVLLLCCLGVAFFLMFIIKLVNIKIRTSSSTRTRKGGEN